jgi:polysaccharide pyruvyl transferase WcaK-like protein
LSELRVLIVNHPSFLNLGNAALLYATIDLIEDAIAPGHITVWCLHTEDTQHRLENPELVELALSPVRSTEGWRSFLRMLVDAGLTLVWGFLDRMFGKFPAFSLSTRTLAAADMVIVQGGDNIADTYGIKPLVACLYGVAVPLLAKKKTLLLSHTIGPFKSGFWQRTTMRLLARTDRIVVRDQYSLNVLRAAGFESRPPVVLLPDVAFLLPVQPRPIPLLENLYAADGMLKVGVVPSSIVFTFAADMTTVEEKRNRYVEVMAEVIDYLTQSCRAQVVLIPHVQEPLHNDLLVAAQISASVGDKSEVTILYNELDPRRVKSIIARLDFLLTARMHPAIHSLSVGVPVIGIDYNAKMLSLLRMFELEHLCVDFSQLDRQTLVETVDTLVGKLDAAKRTVAANRSRLVHRRDYLNQIQALWPTPQRGVGQ